MDSWAHNPFVYGLGASFESDSNYWHKDVSFSLGGTLHSLLLFLFPPNTNKVFTVRGSAVQLPTLFISSSLFKIIKIPCFISFRCLFCLVYCEFWNHITRSFHIAWYTIDGKYVQRSYIDSWLWSWISVVCFLWLFEIKFLNDVKLQFFLVTVTRSDGYF